MNYALHYQRLMDRAESRTLGGYCEKHHVVPRCLDKTSKHTVRLTPEEHFVAHQLLIRLYPGDYRLVFAAVKMTHNGDHTERSNKMYGWLRRAWNASAGDAARAGWEKWRASVAPEEITRIRREAALANMTPEKRANHSLGSRAAWLARKADPAAFAEARASQSRAQKKRYAEQGSKPIGPNPVVAEANSKRVWTDEMRAKSAASRSAYYARRIQTPEEAAYSAKRRAERLRSEERKQLREVA